MNRVLETYDDIAALGVGSVIEYTHYDEAKTTFTKVAAERWEISSDTLFPWFVGAPVAEDEFKVDYLEGNHFVQVVPDEEVYVDLEVTA